MIVFFCIYALLVLLVNGQTNCSSSIKATTTPFAIDGFSWDVIATNVSTPRGIIFGSKGVLLIIESGTWFIALSFSNTSCAQITYTITILRNCCLNHGIEFSPDGKTL